MDNGCFIVPLWEIKGAVFEMHIILDASYAAVEIDNASIILDNGI